jgi:hypothetical protein
MNNRLHDWHFGSYTFGLKYNPKPLEELGNLVFPKTTGLFYHPILAENIRNVLVKYGFMVFAKEELKQTIHGKQIPTHYHLTNFIFNTKAFLDAISNTVNHSYNLGFEKSSIDIKQAKFVNKLKTQDQELGEYMEQQKKWIDDVVFQRDEIIHRKAPLICFRSPSEENEIKPKDTTVKMTVKPVSLFNSGKEERKLQEKYGKIEQDIIEFCHDWISQADQMICKTAERLVQKYNKQSRKMNDE